MRGSAEFVCMAPITRRPAMAALLAKSSAVSTSGRMATRATDTAARIGGRLRQRVRARPSHRLENSGHARASSQADQPIAAVGGRAEHGIVQAEQTERVANMGRAYAGHIGAYDHNRSRCSALHDPLHTYAQAAMALRHMVGMARPWAPAYAVIGRDRDRRMSCRMMRHARQHGHGGMPRKARCGRYA